MLTIIAVEFNANQFLSPASAYPLAYKALGDRLRQTNSKVIVKVVLSLFCIVFFVENNLTINGAPPTQLHTPYITITLNSTLRIRCFLV
jgi:hypothetical protein